MATIREALGGDQKTAATNMPDPNNPFAVADAQTASNIKTAQEQQKLGMTAQDTPFGSVSYVPDPSSPSGFRAVTTLSTGQQGLLDQTTGLRGSALDRLGALSDTPFDLNAGRATELADIQRTFLDPQWTQRAEALQTSLLNRGIRPGSEQYAIAMRQFEQQRQDAYNSMFLDAYSTANQAALAERQLPFSEASTIFGLGQPGAPQWAPVPTPGVAPSDIIGSVAQSNALKQQKDLAQQQMEMQQDNAMNGGLFGLGSAALGGWAMSGFPGASALLALSDRRLKTSITKLANDARGWGLYAFRYLWDAATAPLRYGYMADEVLAVRPEAVREGPNGFLMVDYGALA